MNFNGIFVGLASFLIIGILHPIVIKGEYYFGVKIWPFFLTGGLICIILSILTDNILSIILAVFGFSLLWGIREIFEQKERVNKGWFPKNPKRDH
ncbi:MAG: DUF4491 family protein [Flexilinea sp.]